MKRLNGEIADQQKTASETKANHEKLEKELKEPMAKLDNLSKECGKSLDKAGDGLQTMQQ